MKDENGRSWRWNNGMAVDYENWASSGQVAYNLCHSYIVHIKNVQ